MLRCDFPDNQDSCFSFQALEIFVAHLLDVLWVVVLEYRIVLFVELVFQETLIETESGSACL
jgi:hypothetical protein